MSKKDNFVNLDNARYDDQRKLMEKIQQDRFCPFCPEHRSKAELMPTIRRGKYWSVRKNRWPYENTRVHLLLIHNNHAERAKDISPAAWAELLDFLKWAERKYRIRGGAIGLRFGDSKRNGATVDHLHAQLLVGKIADRNNPKYKPVRLRVG